ncbi:MAG: PAS domain S-box protein [Gemmatimonadetes bacterium]|nr:PAS domain S-box protein [Gemmatimonadota bacterium]
MGGRAHRPTFFFPPMTDRSAQGGPFWTRPLPFRYAREGAGVFARADLLRWLYAGRVALVSGVLLGALFVWARAQPQQTFLATSMFVLGLLVSGGGFWYTHILKREPSRNFLYGQVIFDVLLVTGIVHITGGGDSNLVWIYILVISEGALLLPLPGGVLIGALAAILYFADIVWGHSQTLGGPILLQVGLFALVALATGILGDRLRGAGIALGAVQSELRRLRMDTGDILGTINTGVVTVDGDGRLHYMNSAAENLLGMDARQWLGAPVLQAVERAAPELAALLRRSLEGGVMLFRHKASSLRGRERITLGVSTTLREEPGMPRAVTAIFQDITDLERLELLNRRAERLEAVAELSAAMAHEIKNPLASIRSAVEQFASPSLDASDRETLTRMVVRESERLSRLLSDFIDFARVRIGRVRPLDLCDLVRECATVVRRHPDASERDVQIAFTPPLTPVHAPGDADLLHRALFNLILNAVQFSPRGGVVRLEVEDLGGGRFLPEIDVPRPVRIRVADSGPGVPEEQVERIFDPFFTTREGGTGLGLSVVYRAVEAHQGIVLVERASGGGAEFNVYLPGEEVTAGVPVNA